MLSPYKCLYDGFTHEINPVLTGYRSHVFLWEIGAQSRVVEEFLLDILELGYKSFPFVVRPW